MVPQSSMNGSMESVVRRKPRGSDFEPPTGDKDLAFPS